VNAVLRAVCRSGSNAGRVELDARGGGGRAHGSYPVCFAHPTSWPPKERAILELSSLKLSIPAAPSALCRSKPIFIALRYTCVLPTTPARGQYSDTRSESESGSWLFCVVRWSMLLSHHSPSVPLARGDGAGGEARVSQLHRKHSLGDAKSSLGDAKSSLSDAKSSLSDAKSSLGDAKISLGDAKSSLGDARSSLGGAKSSRGQCGGTPRGFGASPMPPGGMSRTSHMAAGYMPRSLDSMFLMRKVTCLPCCDRWLTMAGASQPCPGSTLNDTSRAARLSTSTASAV
jgi:hypothetical protein